MDDYHRYSYPADGEKSENIRISGILHTVNPIAVESVPVYHENTREYCLLKTERFGTLIQMEVGAMMVGRICNYHGPRYVKKGSEKGRFEIWRFHDPSAGPERPGNFPGEISEKHRLRASRPRWKWESGSVPQNRWLKFLKLVKKKYLTKRNSSVMIAKVTRDGKICRTNSAL